ncbi:hypothetical protein BN164_970008 [Clostridioides difficile T20]|nr:hypothetical protein BN163_1070008 [Clostridioides difficile T5]CCK93982.1 hypothetical protein BN164_970008 [Clostridioides difficile T20]
MPSGVTIKYLEILSSISPNTTIVEAKKNIKGVIKAKSKSNINKYGSKFN